MVRQGNNKLLCFITIFCCLYVSGVMCLPVPAATPSIQSTEPEHQNSVANNNNDAVQPRQLGTGYGPARPIYGTGSVQNYPLLPINNYGGGGYSGGSSYPMNPFISAPYYGMPQQQYGGGGYGPQQQQQYGAGGGSYSTNYNFEPDWSHNAVSCAGGVYNWATNCDFRTLPAGSVTVLAGTISSALTIQTCAASCLALGVSSCNEFTYDPVAQVCFLSLQTIPAFLPNGVALPAIPNTGSLQCGFVGNQNPPAQPPAAQWNLLVPSPPCAADPFEFAMGCNFTAPSSYNSYQQGGAYGPSYGGGYPGPINSMMMMGPYGSSGGGYPSSYPIGNSYRNNKLPTTIGIITTSTSLATCVAVCEVNGNCNNVFSNGVSCVLISGSGLATVQVSSGQCARILRPGLNNNNNNYNYGSNYQQQPSSNSYYRSH